MAQPSLRCSRAKSSVMMTASSRVGRLGPGKVAKETRSSVKVAANPPDVPSDGGGGREWFQSILSRFGPIREKSSNTTVLDFEKPLVELDNRIKEVRTVAEENGVDVTDQIKGLEERLGMRPPK